MFKMKRWLVVMMTALTMACAGSMAAYADETEEVQTEEYTEYEETTTSSTTILAGETRRQAAESASDEKAEDDSAEAATQEGTDNSAAREASDAVDGEEGTHASHSNLVSLGNFRTTAYCPCIKCSEGYGRRTSTGTIAKSNHTIAVDPRVIPYGSKVMINGTVYTAEDRGGGVKGNHIDIFYDTHSQTSQYGSRNVEVFLLS
jgi:3D (Asp-Asp-Asp) domain-containing protein